MADLNSIKSNRLRKIPKPSKSAAVTYQPADLVGTSIADGRYTLESQIGEGNMAFVYKAHDARLETNVVLKVPKPEKIASTEFRKRFYQERQLLVKLSHPHIVRILDMGEHQDLPFIVMQFLSGGDLLQRLKKIQKEGKTLPPTSLKGWIREVGRALDFVAGQGMVHRDVKPANILFDEHKNAFLSDFGLTKIVYGEVQDQESEMTGAGYVVGTPNYLAPEVVYGAPCDGRADQYALGIIVYHLLTGSPPMQGRSSSATLVNQTQKKLPLLSELRPDVPRQVALAVQKAVEKQPNKRFATSGEFAESVITGLQLAGRTKRPVNSSRHSEEPRLPADKIDGSGRLPGNTKVSRGKPGLVQCPACATPLPLRPTHGGRTGKCVFCSCRLKISKDLTKLYQLPSSKQKKTGSRQSNQSDELVIGEEVFGWKLSRKAATILASTLLILTLGATIYLTMFVTGDSESEKLESQINQLKQTESAD